MIRIPRPRGVTQIAIQIQRKEAHISKLYKYLVHLYTLNTLKLNNKPADLNDIAIVTDQPIEVITKEYYRQLKQQANLVDPEVLRGISLRTAALTLGKITEDRHLAEGVISAVNQLAISALQDKQGTSKGKRLKTARALFGVPQTLPWETYFSDLNGAVGNLISNTKSLISFHKTLASMVPKSPDPKVIPIGPQGSSVPSRTPESLITVEKAINLLNEANPSVPLPAINLLNLPEVRATHQAKSHDSRVDEKGNKLRDLD